MKSKIRNAPRAARFAALSAILLWSPAVQAAGPPASNPIFHPSLKAASEAAAADQNLVLLIFSAEWCAPCKQLKKDTLDSPEFLQQGGGLHVADVDVDSDAK